MAVPNLSEAAVVTLPTAILASGIKFDTAAEELMMASGWDLVLLFVWYQPVCGLVVI